MTSCRSWSSARKPRSALKPRCRSPHELVSILYDELILALTLLSFSMQAGDSVKMNAQFGRASGIIHALEAGLDHDLGGPLAESLAGIYRSARTEMMMARETRNAERVDRLAQAFSDMSDSWKKIAA
ncbi:flagellar protein FliS [Chakrabartia godavariana]|nr:flagellar protein FliS [Chakrabartia godavariana]